MNGQRFFRQGTGTPPEFRANETSADTRAVTEHKCGLGYHKEKSVESLISARRLPTNEPSENKPPVSQDPKPRSYFVRPERTIDKPIFRHNKLDVVMVSHIIPTNGVAVDVHHLTKIPNSAVLSM